MRHPTPTLLLASFLAVGLPCGARDETPRDLLNAAVKALEKGEADEALKLTEKALTLDPSSARGHFLRGNAYEILHRHDEAIAEFRSCLRLDPALAAAYDHLGSELFKLGRIPEALASFDRFLELRPGERPGHWKRGIALYYAGKFDEGRRQFAAYEKVSTDDVENAAWHYLCNARAHGVEKARKELLKIGNDRRVPLMKVYALYAGQGTPDDVLAAVREGDPKGAELKERLFYAHLYLGLYYEAAGDRKRAFEHIARAADDNKVGGYMGDVARVQRDVLKKELKQ
jgi:lipoprotein NlpI